MKIFYLCSLVVVCTSIIQAQTIHSTIPLRELADETNKLKLLGLEINDSLFISAHSGKTVPTRAFWVLPSGKTVKIKSPELKNKAIVALASRGDSTFLYYLEQSDDEVYLRAAIQNKQTHVVKISNNKILFPGNFVSIFQRRKVRYLLSVDGDKSKIHLSEIEGTTTRNLTTIKNPFVLKPNSSPFTFISNQDMVSSSVAASANKIYLLDNILVISIDQVGEDGQQTETLISRINLETGETKNGNIVHTSGKNFSTYIAEDCLFQIEKNRSKGAIINIYSLDDFSARQTITIEEQSVIGQSQSLKRDLTKTTDKESVWDAVSNNANAFIFATAIDSTNFLIRLGSYHMITRSGAEFIPIISAVPLLAIAGAAARLAAISLAETESVDQYFYLTWDGQNKPSLASKAINVMQVIDNYDVTSFSQKKRFEYKAYLYAKSKIYGIYRESGSASVNILLFHVP